MLAPLRVSPFHAGCGFLLFCVVWLCRRQVEGTNRFQGSLCRIHCWHDDGGLGVIGGIPEKLSVSRPHANFFSDFLNRALLKS